MTISLEAFSARLDEICTDMEAEILAAKRQFDHRFGVLLAVAASGEEQLAPDYARAAAARMDESERRLTAAVDG